MISPTSSLTCGRAFSMIDLMLRAWALRLVTQASSLAIGCS